MTYTFRRFLSALWRRLRPRWLKRPAPPPGPLTIRTDYTLKELLVILWEADPDLVERFHGYYALNPDVYEEFAKLAAEMKTAGRKQYGAWVLIQALRWRRDLRTTGDVFKINNDYTALYARLLVHDEPVFDGFFEMRRMKPSDRRQSGEERYRRGAAAAPEQGELDF